MLQGTRLRSGASRAVLAVWVAAPAFALTAMPSAWALTPPPPITFDGGPLGKLQLSGGADGYAYALTGAGSELSQGLLGSDRSAGFEFMNGLVQLQKADGLVQFTIQAGSTASLTLGTKPGATSVQTYATGPLRAVYLTLAPTSNFSISAGHVASLEGFESSVDWQNSNLLTTDLFYVENSQSTGVTATYTMGPVSGTVTFGDGFDTQVWNYLQLLATYTINDNNALTLYGSTNLGTTGLGARFYGSSTLSYNSSAATVGAQGVANLANSSVIGGYYSFTMGNLNLVPEVQYVWAKADPSVGLTDYSSNFGAALFASYQFGKSPYSLGGWVEYFSSNGSDAWFLNPGSQGYGLSIAPTWQYKHLFMRGDIGLIHLTRVGTPGSVAYGSNGTGRNQATFLLEAGVLF